MTFTFRGYNVLFAEKLLCFLNYHTVSVVKLRDMRNCVPTSLRRRSSLERRYRALKNWHQVLVGYTPAM